VARPSELKLNLAALSSPRRARSLTMKLFGGPEEPDASLGELGSRKIKIKRAFCPLRWYPFVFLIKTLSDPLLHPVTGVEHCNSASENQNISE